MSEKRFHEELDEVRVKPPEPLHAAFYIAQLRTAAVFFHNGLAQQLDRSYRKVEDAVKDPELLTNLSKNVDNYVSQVVLADLVARGKLQQGNTPKETHKKYDTYQKQANYQDFLKSKFIDKDLFQFEVDLKSNNRGCIHSEGP